MSEEYVQHPSGLIKLLDYRKYKHPNTFYSTDVIGTIFVEVRNGLISNYVDCDIYEDQVDSDGNPILSKINFAPHIRYDLHDNVVACLFELQRLGVFAEELHIETHLLEDSKQAISISNWSKNEPKILEPDIKEVFKDGYSVPVPKAFIDFLLNEIEVVEKTEGSFSHSWYLLRICIFYFLPKELTANDIFNIGYFSSQMSSKFALEPDAIEAQKAKMHRQKGTLNNSLVAPQKQLAKDNVITALRIKVINTHGSSAVRIDTKAASYIHELAEKERPPELWIASKKKVISESSIRNALGRLRKLGKID